MCRLFGRSGRDTRFPDFIPGFGVGYRASQCDHRVYARDGWSEDGEVAGERRGYRGYQQVREHPRNGRLY